MQLTETTTTQSEVTIEASVQLPATVSLAASDVAKATANLRSYFEQLTAEREAWENNAYRTSNEQLYLLLQKCYQTYKSMELDDAEAAALRLGLKDYINTKGYKFSGNTHSLVKIVKCVFGAERRRTSVYGLVLRAALKDNIAVANLPDFIRNNGGIEEIRLAKNPTTKTAKQKASIAADAVQSDSLGVFTSKALSSMLDAGNIGKPVVLIGTWQADGSVTMRAVVQNGNAINVALASYYTEHKDVIEAGAAHQQAANDEQVKQTAIDAAVASAVVNG